MGKKERVAREARMDRQAAKAGPIQLPAHHGQSRDDLLEDEDYHDRGLSAPQALMKSDATALSRAGQLERRTKELVLDIVGESGMRFSPLEWDGISELVRQGVQAGIDLEREL